MTEFNILCDRLPDSISLDGRDHPILTDFRRWIVMLDLFDKCRSSRSRPLDLVTAARCAIHTVMPDSTDLCDLPSDSLVRLLEKMAAFALGGVDVTDTDDAPPQRSEQVLDFACDAEVILASFQSVYGIDLTSAAMHWWRFLALLRAMPSDSPLMQIVSLRRCDTTKIGDDDLRRRIRRAKAAVRIRRHDTAPTDTEKEVYYG